MTKATRLINIVFLLCFTHVLFGQTRDTLVLVSPDSLVFTQENNVVKLAKPNKILEGYEHYDDYLKSLKLSERDTSFRIIEGDTVEWIKRKYKVYFNIDNEAFVVNEQGDIDKYCNEKLCAGFGFDLGYMWYVNSVKYFLLNEKIIFIYSITEDYEKKTFLVSFNKSNLLNARKAYIKGYFNPSAANIKGDILTLYYSENETVKINLKKDLKRKDKETEREAIKRFNHKK